MGTHWQKTVARVGVLGNVLNWNLTPVILWPGLWIALPIDNLWLSGQTHCVDPLINLTMSFSCLFALFYYASLTILSADSKAFAAALINSSSLVIPFMILEILSGKQCLSISWCLLSYGLTPIILFLSIAGPANVSSVPIGQSRVADQHGKTMVLLRLLEI